MTADIFGLDRRLKSLLGKEIAKSIGSTFEPTVCDGPHGLDSHRTQWSHQFCTTGGSICFETITKIRRPVNL